MEDATVTNKRNVTELKTRVATLTKEKQSVENQVRHLTTEKTELDSTLTGIASQLTAKLDAVEDTLRNSSHGGGIQEIKAQIQRATNLLVQVNTKLKKQEMH